MFFDAKNIVSDTTIATTVCIIGAGAAGITLALEMEQRGIDCCLLESRQRALGGLLYRLLVVHAAAGGDERRPDVLRDRLLRDHALRHVAA